MKKSLIKSILPRAVFTVCFLVSACATLSSTPKVVRVGDSVRVYYTCRLSGDGLVTTNEPSVAESTGLEKAETYFVNPKDGPLAMIAGRPDHDRIQRLEKRRPLGFNEAFIYQLTQNIVGLPMGKPQRLTVAAKTQQYLKPGARYLRLARVRTRPQKITISRQAFINNHNRDPEIGEEMPTFQGFIGKITSITGDEVIVQNITPDGGNQIQTAFGKGTVRERGNQLFIDLDVYEGKVIRSGQNFGRIYKVDDIFFYIDYGHPFGGEELSCDVKVEGAPPVTAQY